MLQAIACKHFLFNPRLSTLKGLKKKTVYDFPDLSKDVQTYREWERKALVFEEKLPKTVLILSDLMQKSGSKRMKADGADIAIVLIKYDWKIFRNQI